METSEDIIKRKVIRDNDALQKVLRRLLLGVKETNDKQKLKENGY